LIAAAIISSKGIEARLAVAEAFRLVDFVEQRSDERAVEQLRKEAEFKRGR
jgi:hypothetical protein